MNAPSIALLIVAAALACRWTAYRQRVQPPQRFSPAQFGWWFPPLPSPAEFRTAAARRLEMVGRGLGYVGVAALWYDVVR
jgi:hypothetical protein